jgi:dihydropteroate synthase
MVEFDSTSPLLSPREPMSNTLHWRLGTTEWDTVACPPRLMGIVNVTPDSFSDGGDYLDVDAAVEHALQLVEDGADILDIGGESTRPGAALVPADEELKRVIPVIERLSGSVSLPISIDTSKAAVARAALDAGAAVVNDISGLTFDPLMIDTCAASDCGVVCMHIQGDPRTMQLNPHYDDVVQEVREHLARRLDDLERRGINRERVVIDPGIGFGKTAEHNLELLSNIAALRSLGRPVLIGHSRKSFLKKLLGRPIDERLSGTIGVAIAVAAQSADILRVHDVAAVRDALTAWKAIMRRVAQL